MENVPAERNANDAVGLFEGLHANYTFSLVEFVDGIVVEK
jgi:hypothetical protein